MISDLATASYDGEPYPTSEIIATVAFLLTAGIETVERALTSLLRHLALDRDEWDRLCARIDDADYVLSLSAESLRLYPPVQGTIRRATGDGRVPRRHRSTRRQADRADRVGEPRRGPVRGCGRVPRRALPRQPGPSVHERGGRAAVRRRPPPLRGLASRGHRDGALAAAARPARGLARAARARCPVATGCCSARRRRSPSSSMRSRREGRDPRSRRDGLRLRRAPGARRPRRHPRRRLARAHGRRRRRRPRSAHARRLERDRARCGRSTTRRCSSRSSS